MLQRINKAVFFLQVFPTKKSLVFFIFLFLFSALLFTNKSVAKTNYNYSEIVDKPVYPEQACPILLFIEPVPNICLEPSLSPIQLTVTIQGSDGSGFGIWSGPGVIDPVNGVFDPLDPMTVLGDNLITYTFIENNCVISEFTTITLNKSPDPGFSFTSPICKTEALNLVLDNVVSGANYNWDFDGGNENSGNPFGPYDVTWNFGGTYTITLTAEHNSCIATESHAVEVKEPLAPPTIECNTTTTEITFGWNEVPNALDHEVVFISGQSGTESNNTYSVNNLLPGMDSVTIQVNAIGTLPCGNSSTTKTCYTEDCPSLNIITEPVDDICLYPDVTAIQLVSNIEGYDLPGEWSGIGIADSDLGIFNPNHPSVQYGLNKVYVTYSDNACTYTDTLIINIFEIPEVDAGVADEITCSVKEVTLSGNSIGNNLSYSWNGPGLVSGSNTLQPNVDIPGTYFLNVVDTVSTCINSDSVIVGVDQNVPIADAGLDKAITCDSASVTLQGTAVAGPNYQFNWEGPGINPMNAHDQYPVVSTPGYYILQVLETQNDCYSPKDSVLVEVKTDPPLVEINQEIDVVNCVLLNDHLVGNTIPAGAYEWFNPLSQVVGNNNELIASNHGIYTYQVTDLNTGCVGKDSILVEENKLYPFAEVFTPEPLDCDTREVMVDGNNSFSGPNLIYEWNGPLGGIINGQGTTSISVSKSGNYKLTVLDTINNCTSESTGFVMEIYNAPHAVISDPDEIDCTIKEIDLDGSFSQSTDSLLYQWTYNSNIIGSDPVISIGDAGIYNLVVSNVNSNCSDTSSVDVVFNLPPIENVQIDVSPPSCFGENDGILAFDSIFGGSPNFLFSIDGGNTFVSYNQFYNISAGAFDFVVEDRNGCQWDTSFVIQEPVDLSLDIGIDQNLFMGDTLRLTALFNIPENHVDTIIWYPSEILKCAAGSHCFEVEGRPLSSIYARATLIDLNGCIAKDKIKIEVDDESIAFVPNVFSPNGDNKNDKFTIYAGNSVKKIKYFSVYNRWGKDDL